MREIGEELGVGYILEGTVQRERPADPASRVRVIPQLIRVSDDTHLWADTYDEEGDEVFRVQSDISERVARALDITLLEPERRSLQTRPTDNLEAYEYYLRGNEYYRALGSDNFLMAVEMYERAVESDPDFALAHAALSVLYNKIEDFDKSVRHGRRVCQLEPEDPFSFVAMSLMCQKAGRIEEAEQALLQAQQVELAARNNNA